MISRFEERPGFLDRNTELSDDVGHLAADLVVEAFRGRTERTARSGSPAPSSALASSLEGDRCRPRSGAMVAFDVAAVSILGWDRETPVIECWNDSCSWK